MLQDPFQEREAEKYANPIPSRELILEYLTKRKKPTNHNELATELNIEGEEQREALRRRLRAMGHDGQLVFTRHQCYALPKRLDLPRGTVVGYRGGYGFPRVEGREDDLYLSSEQMKACAHGDQVLAQPLGVDRRGRREAHTVRVLVPKTSQVVGRYFTDAGVGLVILDDSRLSFGILIPPKEAVGTCMGFVVVIELIQRPTRCIKAVGKIVEVPGDNMGTSMAVDTALRTYEIPYIWPQAVEKRVIGLKEGMPGEAKVGCVDLCSLPLTIIDGEDVRDFDDTVYREKKRDGGWRLWVATADVSYYVRPPTPLDQEACSRGTSVYFPSQVVPMLSKALSSGLRSLSPQVDRSYMVYEMTISSGDRLTGLKFYEVVMSSHARLAYTKVWHILQGDQGLREQYAPLVKHIEELHNLYGVLDRVREEHGGISFESEEAEFIFNAERHIERIGQTQCSDTHRLIGECMIMANISTARFVEKAKEPALFCIHDEPTTEAISSFCSAPSELGLELPGGNRPEPRDYVELLGSTADHPDTEMLQTMLSRSMKQTIYNPENRGHFSLALQSYAHFTSPVRRYLDLSLYRAIKYLLAQEQGHKGNTTETGGYHYPMEEMLQLGQYCPTAERRADGTTRDVSDWLKYDFMLNQVGDAFRGVIANVTRFSFFVCPDELFIDGLVYVSSLNSDYYCFDQAEQHLTGESSGQMYRLSDHVEVRVETVNIDERKIDFSSISSERMPCGEGKAAREKTKRDDAGKDIGKHRQMGKRVNFELGSTFRGEKRGRTKPQVDKNAAEKKGDKKAEKPSAKAFKIAAATKAKRTAKKKVAQ